ncbi:MAG TPA: hypothetical protein VFQ36_11455 [Ktedonobacteraceae bacterium]|nr:hypothetical protein [Ktedonobacteraceae bacterium]
MRPYNKRNLRDMSILGGWLFADLLAALMVIFLAAQPAFPKIIPKTPTPVLKPTVTTTPTPTPEPRLDFNYHSFRMDTVDYAGILANKPSAVQAVEQFINSQSLLRNRSAGLVIVYDGASTDADIGDAETIGQAVIDNVLKVMGRRGGPFQRASYYTPIYLFGPGHNTVVMDIYLFQQ